ncbi:MAG: flavin reductase family protein [Parvibaculaceae bacterium]
MQSNDRQAVGDESFDPRDFRRALGAFVTGVTVVTTMDEDGQPRGFTANSFTSVSLEPPLVLACVGKGGASHGVFGKAGHFAVNVLTESQKHVSGIFASRDADRFGSVAWRKGALGAPILEDTAAWFECRMHERIDAGDHLILIGRVAGYGHGDATPLGYCRGNYVSFRLDQDIVGAYGRRTRVGAILEHADGVVFLRDQTGHIRLPAGRGLGSEGEPQSLKGRLAALGIVFNLDFLYSVYEDEGADTLNVYYRGTASQVPDKQEIEIHPFQSLPWERLEEEAMRTLLRRYDRERLLSRYTIYAGNEQTGSYKAVTEPDQSGSG